jgi:hypothetical protein
MGSRMRLRSLWVLLVAGCHLWLTSFTFANPPDPEWTDGVSDEGDYDDIVLAVMAMTAIVPTPPVPIDRVQPVVFREPCDEPSAGRADPPADQRQIRAPPAS